MAGYLCAAFRWCSLAHMPSYLKDHGLSPQVASYALALIGLFNVFGTYIAGTLGQRMPKRHPCLHLLYPRGGDQHLPAGAAVAAVGVRVLGRDGRAVVVHRAPTNATIAQIFGGSICRCWAALVFSATRSAASWASGWAAICMTPPAARYRLVHRDWSGDFAGLVNLPVGESSIRAAAHNPPDLLPLHEPHPPCLRKPTPRALRWHGRRRGRAAVPGGVRLYTVPEFMVMLADQMGVFLTCSATFSSVFSRKR